VIAGLLQVEWNVVRRAIRIGVRPEHGDRLGLGEDAQQILVSA